MSNLSHEQPEPSYELQPGTTLYSNNPELRFDVADTVTTEEAPAARQRIVRLQELRARL